MFITDGRILNSVGVTRAAMLTPKAAKLYSVASALKQKVQRLRKKCLGFKSTLAAAEKISKDAAFQKVSRNMKVAAAVFTKLQMKESHKNPKGRRFSLEEKLLTLTIYKQSLKAYRLLEKLFVLPARKTLTNLLSQVTVNCGLNKELFVNLKRVVNTLKPLDRYCSLIFDEMSIMPFLQYSETSDRILG